MFPRTAPRLILLSALLLPLAQPLAGQDAETQFRKSCMSCHTIGAGKKVGPDLKDLGKRRPHDWSTKFITGAAAMIDGGDPTATTLLREFNGVRMPDLGVTVPEAQALLKLIDDYSAQGKALGTAAISRPATPEDIRNGRLYFTGDRRFKSGAPSCMSCHRAQGVGGWGGGWLGPDLTGATAKYGAGLAGVIENPSFPTMQGVFAKTPASPEEAFQVASFLKSVGSQPPDQRDVVFPVLGVVGLVGGMLLGGHLGRKRLKGVRKNLKPRA
ncbi:MAG: cytochrome c [Holophagaceae bacterium]|uniref:Cytochrome c n=1 Tax=Candidatus Geothrix odensensis TaxID=2954440 RepID=A0A936F479_9BACT|nr:cytochrome c [Candidatus Geothrix odensensis]